MKHKKLSLEDARRGGKINRFIAERQEEGGIADKDRFDSLLGAMAKTPSKAAETKPKKGRGAC